MIGDYLRLWIPPGVLLLKKSILPGAIVQSDWTEKCGDTVVKAEWNISCQQSR